MRKIAVICLTCLLSIWTTASHAILSIEITKGLESALPIAIVPFAGEAENPALQNVSNVVEADLVRSGRFRSLPRTDFLSAPHSPSEVVFKDWRLIKAEALVTGSVVVEAPGQIRVDFQLYDVFKQQMLANYRFTVAPNQLRVVAHEISDIIYQKLTGVPGAFNTRIAYVSKEGRTYKLVIADADGYNPRTILASREPILSPAWSPDGSRLAYVSFERKRPIVYVQDIANGHRRPVAQSPGINGAPAWSPDGRRLALAMSPNGNVDVYVLTLATGKLQRLTHHFAIDTEPTWSPDGRTIAFTSDRSGKPQIYTMDAATGDNVQRITFQSDYSAGAKYSPDGKSIAFIARVDGGFHAALLNLSDGSMQVLTDTTLDDSVTFAPNGQIILYATEVHGRGVLATVSSDGRVRQMLKSTEGDIREPAWSPFYNQSNTHGVTQ